MEYFYLKWTHVLGVILYAGGLMALTRLVGHAVRFDDATARTNAYRIFKRMHMFVDWGGLAMMLVTGIWLIVREPGRYFGADAQSSFMHPKLTLVLVLVICDIVFSRKLFALQGEGPQPKATAFRILHGVVGLSMIGALYCVMVLRYAGS